MKTRLAIAVLLLLAAAVITAGYLLIPGAPERDAAEPVEPAAPSQPVEPAEPIEHAPPDTARAEPEPAPVAPKPFCERDFADVAAREADIAALENAGGLVHILKRRPSEPPYECARVYLARGLDVNAIGAQSEDGLTALHYAVKRNNTDMVAFVIEQGADLNKRATEQDLKPMGYAINLAFNDTRIDRNRVIAMLDEALVASENKEAGANGTMAQ